MPTIKGNIHYVKFIRSSVTAWTNLLLTPEKIDDDTLYFIYEASDTTKGKLYLGQRLISGVGEGDSSSVNISDIGGIYIDDETLENKQVLVYNETNDQWENTPLSDIIGETVSVMTGASAAADGTAGLVPQPRAGQQANFLRGDGTWASINIPIQTSLSGGSAAANDKTVVGGVTVSGHAVTVAKKTMTAGAGISITGVTDKITIAHSNSITAGTAKGDDNKTLTFGGTFTIPTVTYDGQGHITGKGTTTMTMPANPNTDTKVKQTAKTDNVDYKILTTTSASPTSGSAAEVGYGANLAYNPFTNTLKAGNASLTGTLNVTGQATFNQIPVSITPEANSSDTSIATTAFVKNAIGSLSGAMHFKGTTTTVITDGSTTNPIIISGNSYTAVAGDVVLREVTTGNVFEYVWTGSAWGMLGRDTNFKVTQSAVSSPAANGNTTAFIDTISQDTNGNITVTKKNLDTSGTWSGIAAKATADAYGNNIASTYATKQYVNNAGVYSAATLTTPRTIQTDLTSSTAVYFDGSSSITPGITGILGITNGGIGNADGYIRTGQHSGSVIGIGATVEGIDNIASGRASHAEGVNTTASEETSHAEGLATTASGNYSHAEGIDTTASRNASHSEGLGTIASGDGSHAEGNDTTASGEASHAEGINTIASGSYSHVEGFSTIAKGISSHVFGEYNEEDVNNITRYFGEGYGNYVEIVGNGSADNARSNARTLDWNGNEILAGKLTVGINPTNDMDVATKQYVDNTRSPIEIKLENPGYYATYQDTNTNIPHTGPSWAELYAAGMATKEIHLIIDNDNNKERFTSYNLDNNEKIFYFFTAAMPLNMIGFYCIEQNNTDYKITYKSFSKLLIV